MKCKDDRYIEETADAARVNSWLYAPPQQYVNERVGRGGCSRTLTTLFAAIVLCFTISERVLGQSVTASIVPDADSFVRAAAPSNNYGAAGALSVSGIAGTNGAGDLNGAADSLMRISLSNVVTSFSNALGSDWILTGVGLLLTELAVPDNAIFSRGVGAFEIRWVANDLWLEGTGKPMSPTTDGVAWQDLPQVLNSNLDVSLGVLTNCGANGQESFALALPDRAEQDIHVGGEFGLYLTAKSPGIGFTFNSRNFGNTSGQPMLQLTATANPRPRIDGISVAGTNVVVSFLAVSNWNYTLQGASAVAGGNGAWSNLFSFPAQPKGSNVVFVEPALGGRRFYRLQCHL